MAGISRSLGWRHALVAVVVVAGPLLAWRGWLGQPLHPERFDAKQIVVTPVGDDGLRVREVVDQDFGSFQRHGYERRIPNDYGVPVDVEASSPDAPADVAVGQDPERANWTRIRVGDPDVTVGGQHRYVLSYTLPATRVGSGDLSLDIIGTDETLETGSFDVVVAGMELEDPECRITDGTCELVRDGDVYRAELGEVAAGRGITIDGTVTARSETAPLDLPPLPERRGERDDTTALAAVLLPIGAAGAAGVYAFTRRRGRNDVYAGGAADAAFGPGSLPPPGSPPLAVTKVADDRMDDLATTEFEPPRGVLPWTGSVLLRERIDADTVGAWFSGHAARDVLTITKDPADEDHVVLGRGTKFAQAPAEDRAILEPMFGDADTIVLDGYDKDFATAWSAAQAEMARSIKTSGYWKRRPPGSRQAGVAVLMGCGGVAVAVFALLVVVGLSLLFGAPGAIAFAIVVPALVAFVLYRFMLPSRSAAGSAVALRTESFRRFLAASEGRHVQWAWEHGLLREYSAWAVALGTADAWQRAMERTSIPPAELTTGPLLVYAMAPSFSSAHTAPSSSGGAGSFGGGGGGVGGGGGGGSSGSW